MEQEVKVKKPTKIKRAAAVKNDSQVVKQCKEAGGIVHDDNEAGHKRCLGKEL